MSTEPLFIRGMQLALPATEEVKRLVTQVAASVGVQPVWSRDDRRLDVVGPRVAVDFFIEAAAYAQSVTSRHLAAA